MCTKIGSNTYNLSEDFRKRLGEVIKNDGNINQAELKSLKEVARGADDKSALAVLESKQDGALISIDLDDTDNIAPSDYSFKVASREELRARQENEQEGINPTSFKFKVNAPEQPKSDNDSKTVTVLVAGHLASPADKIIKQVSEIKTETPKTVLKSKEVFVEKDLKKLEQLLGKPNVESLLASYKKLPNENIQNFVVEKINKIISDPALSVAKKQELLKAVHQQTGLFLDKQVQYTKKLEELKVELKPEIDKLKGQITEVKTKIEKLKEVPGRETEIKALESAKKDIETRLSKNADSPERILNSYEKTLKSSDELRFRDIIDAHFNKFGPPYEGFAKEVNNVLPNIKDSNGKQVFKNPEEFNIAIRKRPVDLTDSERKALKEIRQNFHKVPDEGIVLAKVTSNDGKFNKFVIEPKYLKEVKTEEQLIDLLKLDYPGSEFVNADHTPKFKLSDIDISIGRVHSTEVDLAFSKEFGGTRDGIIYQYPYSGSGFTTPQNDFPKPELDLGAKPIEDVKKIKWNEFTAKSQEELEKLAPSRPKPEVKGEAKGESKAKTEEVKPKAEPEAKLKEGELPKSPASKVKTVAAEIDNLSVDDTAKQTLKRLAEHPSFSGDEKALKNIIEVVKNSSEDKKALTAIIETLKTTEPDVLAKSFANAEAGSKVLELAKKLIPVLEKLGIEGKAVIAKVAKGLGKALPVIGGVASAYDTARLTSIALKGKDFSGTDYTKYPDGDPRNTPENLQKLKDIRALALLGAAANATDTVLAVIEATGIGNIDLPVQLGLAGVEILVDLAVDHFREHPESFPKELSIGIRATALAGGILFPPAGTAAVAVIYGIDGTIDIANELTKLSGEAIIKSVKQLNDLQAKALDKGLESFAKGVNGLADVIRNPEKYAEALGRKVDDIVSEATDLLKKKLEQGEKVATHVYEILTDIATNPGKYGKAAANLALETGKKIISGAEHAYEASVVFVKNLVNKGVIKFEEAVDSLKNLGTKAAQATKQFIIDGIQSTKEFGQKFSGFLQDVYQNPGKYGDLAIQTINAVKVAIVNGVSTALDKLEGIARKGISGARQALNSAVDAAFQAGKATKELVEYVINHPVEAGTRLIKATKDLLINSANGVKTGINNAIDYLKDLHNRVGAAIGRFEDTLVDLAKQGGEAAKEIFSKYFNVIKNRIPDIIDAAGNLASAVKEKLVQYVPGAKLIDSLINSGVSGFRNLIDIAAKYSGIAKQFITKITNEISDAWNQSSITNLQPLKDVLAKYYDQAVAAGGEALRKAREFIYEAIQSVDVNQADDWIPDWSYDWIKP